MQMWLNRSTIQINLAGMTLGQGVRIQVVSSSNAGEGIMAINSSSRSIFGGEL